MRQRGWRGWADLPLLQATLAEALRDRSPAAMLHPGDLAWWLGWPTKSHEELATRIAIWEQDERVVAWAVAEDSEVGVWVVPGSRAVEAWRAVDGWLEDRPPVDRYARTDDEAGLERLTAAGYGPVEGLAMIAFLVDLDALGRIEADPLVAPVTPADLDARASVTHVAFRNTRAFEPYARDYAAFASSPAYPSGWDLLVRTPSGEPAACAIAWPDPVSRIGNFEPVATHPQYQRQGFGSAVLRDGMRRLRNAGMRQAMVHTFTTNTGGIALYRSVGFVDAHVEQAFRKA